MVYITLLRGVNVSGQKIIKMNDLIDMFQSLHFSNITSYLQSGNVVFVNENTNPRLLEDSIKLAIQQKFNFEVPVIVRALDDFARILANNPFLKIENIDVEKLHVTFFTESQNDKDLSKIDFSKEANEAFEIIDREVYLYCPNGYGRTKLTNQTFEKKLKTTATTRNWKTVSSLLEIAKSKLT